jgi:chromate transporter
VSWEEVLVVFLRAAFLSVNGSTTLALLKQDLVDRLGVLTAADFATGVAVGAVSPGPLGYGCIALGFLADGWRGAVVATVTSWMPAFLSLPLHAFYRRLKDRPWITGVTWGVAAAGTGLLFAMVATLSIDAFRSWKEAAVGIAVLVLLARGVSAPTALALAAVSGALFLR